MTTPSEDSPATDTSPWKTTLGELDVKMGVKITEEPVQRVVAIVANAMSGARPGT
jgi:hypothetical protein